VHLGIAAAIVDGALVNVAARLLTEVGARHVLPDKHALVHVPRVRVLVRSHVTQWTLQTLEAGHGVHATRVKTRVVLVTLQ